MRPQAAIALVIFTATLAVFVQVRDHEFVNYDDYVYLSKIEMGLTADGVRRAFTGQVVSNWIPLTWLTLLVDYELYGRAPAGYHLTSVVLHALTAALLFLVLARMTGAPWRSAFVAGVFAVHPVHVESIAWLSERKDVLSGLMFALLLHAYLAYTNRPRAVTRYLLVLLALAGGLLAKPMLVTAPFVLLLLDYWPLGRLYDGASWPLPAPRLLRRALLEKLPMFAMVAVVSAIAVLTQDRGGSLAGDDIIPLSLRLWNAIDAYAMYVAVSFWPTGLAVFYPHPMDTLGAPRLLAAGALLIGATGAALAVARRRPYAIVGWLWFVGMLVPVIGLVQVGAQARADRYLYLPQIGLAIAVTWAAADAFGRQQAGRVALAVAGSVGLVALAVGAWHQTATWRNTITLNERALAVTTENYRAHHGLAAALSRAGRVREAESHYRAAVRLRPGRARSHIGLAENLARQGKLNEAIPAYERALELAPEHLRATINFANLLARVGRLQDARDRFERALALNEKLHLEQHGGATFLISLHLGFARVLVAQGDDEAAIRHLEAAVALRPGHAAANTDLGAALVRAGRFEEAVPHLERARERGVDSVSLHEALAAAHAAAGRLDAARRAADRAESLAQ